MEVKERIIELLEMTERPGIDELIKHLDEIGFYEAPCSTIHHLSKPGGLAEHSLNVYNTALKIAHALYGDSIPDEMIISIILCSILHDIGKCGQFGKENYVPNMLKGRATKANPTPEPKQSADKPYKINPELLYVDHEVRALPIIAKYIDLTEEEQYAILMHNGLYSVFKYQIPGKETPLLMIIHFADLWCSRVIEK